MAGIASEVVDSGTTSAYAEGTSAGRQCAVMGSVSGSEKEITTYHGKTAHTCLDNTAHTLNRQSKQTPDWWSTVWRGATEWLTERKIFQRGVVLL